MVALGCGAVGSATAADVSVVVTTTAAFAPYTVPPPDRLAGAELQHSLRLLSGLRCQGERPIRVLFYGQSITEQAWWRVVADELRARYPNAPLVIENRAIGGHEVQRLLKTAEADLYPFQPDLVIFHAYGSHRDYETLIRRIRERTTADVLIATDHIVDDAELGEETDAKVLTAWWWTRWAAPLWPAQPRKTQRAWWNQVFLPDLARRNGLALVDVRGAWKAHLRQHRLEARALLKDDVHLNAQGEYLMGEILKPAFAPALLHERSCDRSRVEERVVGRDVPVRDGRIELSFEGNRAELQLSRPVTGPIEVRVDGRLPSQWAGSYGFTRASAFPGSNWPALLQVRAGGTAPVAETWTATLRSVDDPASIGFDVSGSVTGRDGSGVSSEPFRSRSGRIVIEPGDWNLAYAEQTFKRRPPVGFQIRWETVLRSVDKLPLVAGEAAALGINGPLSVDIIQGLGNGPHKLELSGAGLDAVQAIRIYRPPAR